MGDPALDLRDELIERFTPEVEVPSPAMMSQVRRTIEARMRLLQTYGAYTPAELADLYGSAARNRGALMDNWRRAQKLLVVSFRGRLLVPAFQVTADGSPHPVLADLIRILRPASSSDWSVALWFISPNGAFPDWAKPADLLVARRDEPVRGDDEVGSVLVASATDHVEPGSGFGTQPSERDIAYVAELQALGAIDPVAGPDVPQESAMQTAVEAAQGGVMNVGRSVRGGPGSDVVRDWARQQGHDIAERGRAYVPLPGSPRLLSRADVARTLHVDETVVDAWVQEGALSVAPGAGEPRFPAEAVLAFLHDRADEVGHAVTAPAT